MEKAVSSWERFIFCKHATFLLQGFLMIKVFKVKQDELFDLVSLHSADSYV